MWAINDIWVNFKLSLICKVKNIRVSQDLLPTLYELSTSYTVVSPQLRHPVLCIFCMLALRMLSYPCATWCFDVDPKNHEELYQAGPKYNSLRICLLLYNTSISGNDM